MAVLATNDDTATDNDCAAVATTSSGAAILALSKSTAFDFQWKEDILALDWVGAVEEIYVHGVDDGAEGNVFVVTGEHEECVFRLFAIAVLEVYDFVVQVGAVILVGLGALSHTGEEEGGRHDSQARQRNVFSRHDCEKENKRVWLVNAVLDTCKICRGQSPHLCS